MPQFYDRPYIPETITVHLGAPDAPAENVTVPFLDYVKNVASSEIYPTWPDAAIRANILAQVSYVLNRVYTEFYPSRGYAFDITNDTQFDQRFIFGRDYFEPIARAADELFNDYIVRQGSILPLFAAYCNGTTSTCDGLSQWGSVDLANRGRVALEILRHYYGADVDLVFNAPVQGVARSYPGLPVRLGSAGDEVRILQRELRRISDNYPALPKVTADGFFGVATEAAVRRFQQIFYLPADGVVDKATWYRIKSVYNSVKRLSELYSEGLTLDEAALQYPRELTEGAQGEAVRDLQYFLAVLSYFDERIPQVRLDGVFDANMAAGVRAFQAAFGLPVTGGVDRATWNRIVQAYAETRAALSADLGAAQAEIYPGRTLTYGMQGEDVALLQQFLRDAAERHDFLPAVAVTGVFDSATDAAVRAVEREAGLTVNGAVGPATWERVVQLSRGQ